MPRSMKRFQKFRTNLVYSLNIKLKLPISKQVKNPTFHLNKKQKIKQKSHIFIWSIHFKFCNQTKIICKSNAIKIKEKSKVYKQVRLRIGKKQKDKINYRLNKINQHSNQNKLSGVQQLTLATQKVTHCQTQSQKDQKTFKQQQTIQNNYLLKIKLYKIYLIKYLLILQSKKIHQIQTNQESTVGSLMYLIQQLLHPKSDFIFVSKYKNVPMQLIIRGRLGYPPAINALNSLLMFSNLYEKDQNHPFFQLLEYYKQSIKGKQQQLITIPKNGKLNIFTEIRINYCLINEPVKYFNIFYAADEKYCQISEQLQQDNN